MCVCVWGLTMIWSSGSPLTLETAGRWDLYVAQPVHAEDLPVGLAVVGEHAGAEVVSGGDGPAAGVLRGRGRGSGGGAELRVGIGMGLREVKSLFCL